MYIPFCPENPERRNRPIYYHESPKRFKTLPCLTIYYKNIFFLQTFTFQTYLFIFITLNHMLPIGTKSLPINILHRLLWPYSAYFMICWHCWNLCTLLSEFPVFMVFVTLCLLYISVSPQKSCAMETLLLTWSESLALFESTSYLKSELLFSIFHSHFYSNSPLKHLYISW